MAEQPEAPSSAKLAACALALLLFCTVLALIRTTPPAARSAATAESEFSAARARALLAAVLGDGAPHPVGSLENGEVRARLVERLRQLGYAPEIETGVACSRYGTCARTHNVIAKKPGKGNQPAVLLVAHYDSVPAGAGASDDGLGVATLLEVARALGREPPLTRPIFFLFDDGEELGLLGAETFVAGRRLADSIGVVVNIEARGTDGPSLMFETSGESAALVEVFARAARRPLTGSLFYAVYRRLPNDTDLTVFKRHGVVGLNLAVVGGVSRYHTPLDDLDHLSLGSLQHHGDHVLGLARELGDATSLPGARGGDAVFFDVLALGIVRWPIGWTAWIGALSAAAFGLALALALRRGLVRGPELLRALAFFPVPPLAATLTLVGFFALLSALGRAVPGWPAHPVFVFVLLPSTALAASAGLAAVRANATPASEWAACFTWWTLLALVLALVLPEGSYLFVVPALFAAAGGLALQSARPAPEWLRALALLAPAGAAATLWLPVVRLSYDALGLMVPALLAAATAVALTPFAPVLGALSQRALRRVVSIFGTAAALAAVAVALAPPYSPESPQRMTVAYHFDADARRGRFLVDGKRSEVPPAMLAAAPFSLQTVDASPWIGTWLGRALEAPAPAIELSTPSFDIIEVSGEGEDRRVRARVRSTRGADLVTIHLSNSSRARLVSVEGKSAVLRSGPLYGTITFAGAGSEGFEIELQPKDATSVLISDHARGLPDGAKAPAEARPAWAVPSQLGDVSIASRSVRL